MEIERASFEPSEIFPADQFQFYLNKFREGFFVAEDFSDKIVAYAILACAPTTGYILSIAVHPQKRNQGVASDLLDFLESKCQEKGISKIRLDVRTDNLPAIRLYRKLGLLPHRVKKNFYGKGSDGILMEKPV